MTAQGSLLIVGASEFGGFQGWAYEWDGSSFVCLLDGDLEGETVEEVFSEWKSFLELVEAAA